MRNQQTKRRQSRQDSKKKRQLRSTKVKTSLARVNSSLAQRIEMLLLVPAAPLTQDELSIRLNASERSVRMAVRQLQAAYVRRNSPFLLVDDADGWRFTMIENPPVYPSTTHSPPSADDEPLLSRTTEEPTSHHLAVQEAKNDIAPLDENHATYKEFLDELNEKISAIAHHNKNNNADASLREKLLSDIEGLMHSAPAPLATEEMRHEIASRENRLVQ